MQIIAFVIWLFYLRQCAYWGSRRVIGGRNALLYGIFFNYLGMFFILSSRKIK
jgi:hypothetical protein